jgi:hypothetical protein
MVETRVTANSSDSIKTALLKIPYLETATSALRIHQRVHRAPLRTVVDGGDDQTIAHRTNAKPDISAKADKIYSL